MTEQEFIDYIWYKDEIKVTKDDIIRRVSYQGQYSTFQTYYKYTHSDGRKSNMRFFFNDREVKIQECINIVNAHIRNEKLNRILNG